MDGASNNLKRKEPADAFGLNFPSGNSSFTEQAQSSNSQTISEASSSSIPEQQNHLNCELGFAMMAGEDNNPWRNVRPRFNGSPFGSFVHPIQHPDGLSTDVIASRSGDQTACQLCRSSFFTNLLQSVLDGSDDFIMEHTNCMHNIGEYVEDETDSDLPEFDMDDWEMETDADYNDVLLALDGMSYEELVQLEELLGTVSAGLTHEIISQQMRCYLHFEPSGPEIDEAQCSICLERFYGGDLVGCLDCGHEYHYDCIKEWLFRKNVCPLCNSTALSC